MDTDEIHSKIEVSKTSSTLLSHIDNSEHLLVFSNSECSVILEHQGEILALKII